MTQPAAGPTPIATLQQHVAALAGRAPGDPERAAAALALAQAAPTAVHWMDVAFEAFSVYRFRAGHAALERALACDPDFLPARWAAFQFPLDPAPASAAAIDAYRQRWLAGLAAFEALEFRDPRRQRHIWGCIGQCTAFYLHYVTDAVAEQARYGALVHRMMAALVPPSPAPAPPARARRRIVFASAFLRDHTVARLFVPLFERLDPAQFEVHAVALAPASEAFVRDLAPHITLHHGPLEAAMWHQHLQRLAPDVLVYLDIGMHPLPQALAALRIAPVQAVLWGHPVSTGLPTLDWFVSAAAFEPADADTHYSERLLRLPGLGNGLRPPPPASAASPAFEREPGRIELFCAQSVYKLTPDHDALFARVLARLPHARLHLIPHELPHIRDWLAARLTQACAAAGVDMNDRLVLHPLLPLPEYLALAGACDLALDTLHWSGGMSSLDLLGQGLPIVTVAGGTMRSRQTAALLHRLDAAELVAADADGYVDRIVALAGDPARRQALSRRLRDNAPRLYANDDAVAGFARFLAGTDNT